jgi:CBS domain-containing protein
MADREIDHLPVVDGGKVVGIVTTTDLAVSLSGARESGVTAAEFASGQ